MKIKGLLFAIGAFFTSTIVQAKTPYKSFKLDNGLEILLMESHKVPLVTIALSVKAGAMTETKETNGLTHLWEHMFFKGNKRIPSQDLYMKKVRQLGISFNGTTGAEQVNYFFTLPSVFTGDGIQFMADAIRTPLISDDELKKEIGVVMNEYQRSASHPSFDMRNLVRHTVYGEQEYLRDPLGVPHVLQSVTRKQLMQIKEDVFVPANSVLIVGGDFDEKIVMARIHKEFASWKNPDGWKPVKRPDFPPFPKTQEIVMIRDRVQTPSFRFIFEGPKVREEVKDSFAADVLISLLNLSTSKFYQKFNDSGLTLGSGLGYYTQAQAAQVNLYGSAKPEKLEKARKALLAEAKEWAKPGYFTQEQLEDVRRGLLIDHKRSLNSVSSYVKGTLGFWWTVTGLDYYDSYLDNLRKTTLNDVRNFVKKYLVNKPYISTVLLNSNDAKTAGLKDNSAKLVEKHLGAYRKG